MILDDLSAGPHRRYDPLRDEWVLVSAGRTNRPWLGKREAVAPVVKPTYDPGCYLCPGNTRVSGAQNPRICCPGRTIPRRITPTTSND